MQPTGLTFGDAGRNILRNPWRTNFDMALLKHFAVTESKYFEFRAEAFNVFNHVEYTWLGGDAGSAADNSGRGTDANTSPVTAQRHHTPRATLPLHWIDLLTLRLLAPATHSAAGAEVYFLEPISELA